MNTPLKITIFANIVHTNTLAGGDRIFTECAKQWINKGHDVTIVTNDAGLTYCTERGVSQKNILLLPLSWTDRFGVYVAMLAKAIFATLHAIFYHPKNVDIIFASSFFVPDMLPAVILKLRHPKAVLATACYLFSTQKWGRDYSGGKLKGLLFYLNELIAFWLSRRLHGLIVTASEFDRAQFAAIQHFRIKSVLAFRGGVDSAFFQSIPSQVKKYDAVFIGRFHPQKCLPDLIAIWELVVRHDHTRTLALVGDGIQKKQLTDLVRRKKLEKNIKFFGTADGVEKTKILKASRVFISASLFDSGNIALDEALACGTPGIVYDLLRLSYPSGVLKVPIGDSEEFAMAIMKLLDDNAKRLKMAEEAQIFANSLDWKKKAEELLRFMTKAYPVSLDT